MDTEIKNFNNLCAYFLNYIVKLKYVKKIMYIKRKQDKSAQSVQETIIKEIKEQKRSDNYIENLIIFKSVYKNN